MKAAVLTAWKNLEIQDVPVPQIGPGECLIKVHYAGICGSDVHIYHGDNPVAVTPVTPGHEFMGTVAEIQSDVVTDITVGDRVVALPISSCGRCSMCQAGTGHVCKQLKIVGVNRAGGFAEYVRVPAEKVIAVGDALPDTIAALAEPFAVGFHVNRRGTLKIGDTALIIGGGPIGLTTGIVAKMSGAAEVIITELNPDRIALLQAFGFTALNPSQKLDQAKIQAWIERDGFDVVFETSGSQAGLSLGVEASKARGTIVLVGFPSTPPCFDVTQAILKELSIVGSRVYTQADFQKTIQMLEEIVSHNLFDLDQFVSDILPLAKLEQVIGMMERGETVAKVLVSPV